MKMYHTILSVVLAVTMLVAGVGVTINFHLCAGKVRSVAVNVKADGCHDEQSCRATHTEKKRGCCADKTFVLKAKESTASIKALFKSVPPFKFIKAVLPVLQDLTTGSSVRIAAKHYTFYKPPRLYKVSLAFLQSFLI